MSWTKVGIHGKVLSTIDSPCHTVGVVGMGSDTLQTDECASKFSEIYGELPQGAPRRDMYEICSTERVVPESFQASICGIQTLSSGDSIWLMVLTDDDGELHQVDIPSQASCNQVKVVDIVRAQKEEPHTGRVLKVIKANQKPTIGQKQK